MTTNKPEVVAWYTPPARGTLPVVALNDRSKRGEPLIRLSDYEALQHELDLYTFAFNEWLEKSEWVHRTGSAQELGMHRADVMKGRIETLQVECEKLRKDAERYRPLLEEPVGYVSPRLLDTLRSGKTCGITMEDKPDAHNGVTIPLYTAAPEVQMEVVGWQFYQDGKWWNGDDRIKDHKRNTKEAGFRVRDVYAAPQPECGCCGQTNRCDDDCDAVVIGGHRAEQQPAPDVAGLVEALELISDTDPDDETAWFHETANNALAAYRKGDKS